MSCSDASYASSDITAAELNVSRGRSNGHSEWQSDSKNPLSRRVQYRGVSAQHLTLHNIKERLDEKLQWRQRLRHFTWNFFSLTMATGGIANVIHTVPFRFDGLTTIGTIFLFANLVFFFMNCCLITLRFIRFPETFKASVTHPTESLFMPAAVVSFGIILTNTTLYGLDNIGLWLHRIMVPLFWVYATMAVLTSAFVYLLIWSTQTFTISNMTPIWVFPAYPLLIVGPFAGYLAPALVRQGVDNDKILNIMIGGFTLQGIGFLVSLTIYSCFVYRLMTEKLPKEPIKPGIFVSIGPCAFTAGAIINLASSAADVFPDDYMGDGHLAAMMVKVVANFASLWLWGTAMWFFVVSVGAHWTIFARRKTMEFAMVWYSFIFPNTALITATFAIGRTFYSPVIQWIGCIKSIFLITAWLLVFIMMIRGIILKQVLWPQKQEDRDEGGFVAPPMSRTLSARTSRSLPAETIV